ncbi:DNA topoisomerase 3 [Desulfitobacterium sp.]|uniref:type IA DNA topoisomerase n=1 Tax=Desulfitobacterium sp. TaxID=49981 RepID=UPI002BB194FD|nr:DNA topoisomerase 3 [Desulfitobacterium sp.]HVJ48830.1 DNA topoisomerase 3 [Desulfitobacterium sp.]
MGKILIVAEKPSQAREYAKTLGVNGRGEGYFQNEGYIITWCIGHLLELNRPEEYMNLDQVGKKWGLHRLPVLPSLKSFKHQIKASTRSQYTVLTQLLNSPEIDKVICGTDADREGQLLFQEVWDIVQCTKPLKRLWISSLTAEAIREGMSKLRTEADVEGLAQAGYGRSYGDWDFGMNLTEGFSALFGSFDPVRKKPNVISIGRVQTPTLALVVEREWEIEQFNPVHYCEVEAEFKASAGSYTGKWVEDPKAGEGKSELSQHNSNGSEHGLNLVKAKEIVAKVKGKPGNVHALEAKEVQEPHPLLFDLTSLTVAASKRFGMSADQVLKIAQSLYEKKATTYPRTDCNFLPPDILPKLPAHLRALQIEPYTAWVEEALSKDLPKGKRVINQITAHHAIIPTTEKISPEKLSLDERKLWDMIVRRFLSVWFPPARYETTVVLTQVEEEYFRTRGKVLIDLGWKKLFGDKPEEEGQPKRQKSKSKKDENGDDGEDGNSEFVALPVLSSGETVTALNAMVKEKETKPPKRYTQGDLLKAMENAGKRVEDELLQQQLKGKGLGTVATRPAILENLLNRGYLLQEQRALHPTEKGKELIRLIKVELPKAQLLVSAEMTGQMEFELAQVEQGKMELTKYMAQVEKAILEILDELRAFEKAFGKRPLAHAPVKAIGGGTKATSTRNRTSTLTATKEHTKNTNTQPEVLGLCPFCGGDIIEGKKGYGCLNWRQGCTFVVWKEPICGKVLSPAQVKKLLKKGSTDLIKGFRSKSGKPFSAYLVWVKEGSAKLKFVFEKD